MEDLLSSETLESIKRDDAGEVSLGVTSSSSASLTSGIILVPMLDIFLIAGRRGVWVGSGLGVDGKGVNELLFDLAKMFAGVKYSVVSAGEGICGDSSAKGLSDQSRRRPSESVGVLDIAREQRNDE